MIGRISDLRGRVPLHQGQGPGLPSNRSLGERAGTETVTLATPHYGTPLATFFTSPA